MIITMIIVIVFLPDVDMIPQVMQKLEEHCFWNG